jgi:prepilin-type N-terminal cleavage/methylation domain-containing protein
MSDDGYTLAEMLAALTILGLAMGGLGLVVSLIARQQLTANRIQARLVDERAADQALTRLLVQAEADDIRGDGRNLSFTCGEATCGASLRADGRRTLLVLQDRSGPGRRLRLRRPNLGFSYVDGLGAVGAWPRPTGATTNSPGTSAKDRSLRAVLLTAPDASAPLAVGRVWSREPRDCQFDGIIGACRVVAP